MSVEPEKFFIGLMDFFSILLPGALLTFVLMDRVDPAIISGRFAVDRGAEGWVAFLIASYLAGHLAFLLGSWLDELYDWLRRQTPNHQVTRLARHGRLLPWPVRASVWLIFKRERDAAVERAGQIKRHALAGLDAAGAVNTFQWCKALLNQESPSSLAAIQRFEADSKFFRSFTVGLLVLAATWPFQQRWPRWGLAIVLALLLLAVWRYMEQRFKATNQAYWSAITLTARKGTVVFDTPAPPLDGVTHAGGVVVRGRGPHARYLLVETKNDRTQWVLPKGHIEASARAKAPAARERPEETAIREVHEETGVWASIRADLHDVSYAVNGTTITVRFFLMDYAGRGMQDDADRRHVWLPLDEALTKATHRETRELLQAASRLVATRAAASAVN